MANESYAWPLLAVGVLGLAVTSYLASSPGEQAVPAAKPAAEPPRPAVAVSPPPAEPAPAPAAKPVMDAGREAACQAEFDKVVREEPIDFLSTKADLSPAGKTVLDDLFVVARACSGLKIEIQGHTDNQGKRWGNVQLSRDRAEAVKKYLVERGLSPDLMTAVGFGPDRPAVSNRTSAGRARNRRIEFRVSRVELE